MESGAVIWAEITTLPDPLGLPSLIAGVIGLASGGYLAISGVMRTVHQSQEKSLLDRIAGETKMSDDLRNELTATRSKLADYRVLCEHMMVELKVSKIDPSALETLQSMVAEIAKR
jgi:hypothetical protein